MTCSVMLYSSTREVMTTTTEVTDSNTYRPFRTLDSTVMSSIAERLDSYDGAGEEGKHIYFVAYVQVWISIWPRCSAGRTGWVPHQGTML